MPKQSEEKFCVVTGGSAGIGSVIVEAYLERGYSVISISRSSYSLSSKKHFHFVGDLSSSGEVEKVFADIGRISGHLDVLINNVGRSEWRSLDNIDETFLESMLRVNLFSTIFCTKYAVPFMRPGCSIVNISSLAARRGTPNNSVYCATKFALSGFTQSMAKELGAHGIRINSVCPVLIQTPGLQETISLPDGPAYQLGSESFLNQFAEQQTALGRLPSANDVAEMCLYLTSGAAGSVTGQSINVDCGTLPQ